jgi:glucose/arabinose dehydrogenase
MRRILCALALALALGLPAAGAGAKEGTFRSSAGPLRVERVAGPFAHPWAVAFLPGGAKLVTERGGRLWHLGADGARREVSGVPEVHAVGQGGLLDVAAARDFARTREIFLTYAVTEPDDPYHTRTVLARARLAADGGALEALEPLFRQEPAVVSADHYGSRVVEAPDGTLFVTVGDRNHPDLAQTRDTTIGKVVRVARDGSVPPDNPFADDPGTASEIWSIGHRNPQGAALDAEGRLWTVEHGAHGGDEINRPEAGANYGWPRISYGTDYSGAEYPGTHAEGLEQPLHYWDPSIAPSGMTIYSGRLWPDWEGDVFVGALRGGLSRLPRAGTRLGREERLMQWDAGRVRDVREGPEGALWFLTDAEDGALYRISPAR